MCFTPNEFVDKPINQSIYYLLYFLKYQLIHMLLFLNALGLETRDSIFATLPLLIVMSYDLQELCNFWYQLKKKKKKTKPIPLPHTLFESTQPVISYEWFIFLYINFTYNFKLKVAPNLLVVLPCNAVVFGTSEITNIPFFYSTFTWSRKCYFSHLFGWHQCYVLETTMRLE